MILGNVGEIVVIPIVSIDVQIYSLGAEIV